MLQFNIAYLQEVCLLDEKQRKNLMTYYGKLSEVEKMEVERVRTEIWLKNKHLLKTEVKTEYNFAMQLLAIAKLQADEKAVNKLVAKPLRTTLGITAILLFGFSPYPAHSGLLWV